jgi:hypothetical protein
MPTIAKGKMRRLMEAAQKDKTPMRFVEEFCEALAKKEIQVDSIRQIYEEIIPHGREMVDSWNPRNEGGQISLHTVLENAGAVVSAAFSRVNGQIAYSMTLEGYQQEDFVFKNMIPVQSTPYDGEKIPGISGLGDKGQVINEGQPYPYAGVNEDFIETPSTTKRGIITAVTREAVYFDRTSRLLESLRQVGEVIGLGHEKEAIDCLIDENRTGHRYNRLSRGTVATYGDNSGNHDWDNLQASNALVDWTDIDNAEQLLYSILDPNTGEPIVMTGNMRLICTRGLRATALRIQRATSVEHANPGYATSGNPVITHSPTPLDTAFEVVTSRQLAQRLATDTDWFYGDPTKAFKYMENWPLAVVQAPANSHDEFTRDIVMQFKASRRGAYATIEPRAMVKCTA